VVPGFGYNIGFLRSASASIACDKAQFVSTALENVARRSAQYLKEIADTFPEAVVNCTVEKGTAAEVIIDKAAAEKDTLINMATHGHSGIKRWLLGSVAEKVLRGTTNDKKAQAMKKLGIDRVSLSTSMASLPTRSFLWHVKLPTI
jgi:nucleotide-binding universal stress UspA family protein